MSEAFESSRRKIKRAEKHMFDLQREIEQFQEIDPYERVIEPHPHKPDHQVHKIRMTKELPEAIGDIAFDIVGNLRAALDNAAYSTALAVAKPGAELKNTAFPFAGSVAQMANSLGRAKDVPREIQSLFFGFQPYFGGDDLLCALNELCNTTKHKIAVPAGVGQVRRRAAVAGTGFFDMPDPHVWDSAKNEMVLITFGPGAEFDYHLDFRLFIAVGEVKVVGGQELFTTLWKLGTKVHGILEAIESDAKRIGIIK
jgi:hypothetical protein